MKTAGSRLDIMVSKPRQLFYLGEIRTIREWSRIMGYEKSLIHNRLKRGWSIEKAIGCPSCGRGESHYGAKLTETEVVRIVECREDGVTIEDLADIYGVSVGTIRKIVYGKSWVHVTNIGRDNV